MKKNIYIPFVCAILLLMASCHKKEPQKEASKAFVLSDTMARMITIDSVQHCNINDALTLSGEVNFDENSVVKIFPRGSGQVLESKVTFGDKVTKGQVLAVIRSADVAGDYADLSGATADVNIAKRQMDNAEALYKNGIASEKDFIEAQQNYQKTLAAKEKIQSALNINGGSRTTASGTYILTAPIDGYLVEKKVNAGSFIRPDMGDNLFTISDMKDVWVLANVYEGDIPKVKEGNQVQVTTLAYPNKIFTGVIDKVSEVLDPTDKAMKVRVKLDNREGLLKPEMYARIMVSSQEGRQAVCVPSSAVISQEGKNYVVVYKSNTDVSVQPVTVLKVLGDRTYITDGLQPGQQIVTHNQILLYNALTEEL